MNRTDIFLINMPSIETRPSLPLGLLKGILKRDGFNVKVIYGNLLFIERLGLEFYKIILHERSKSLVDWLFMPFVFPEYKENIEDYINFLFRNRMFHGLTSHKLKEKLLEYRKKTRGFLTDLTEEILKENPSIAGCTSIFLQYIPSLALLREINLRNSQVITVMGGPQCETELGLTTHKTFPWIDYIVSGEADHIISRLVNSILQKKRDLTELPAGVFAPIHRHRGYPEENLLSETDSLSSLPHPDYDDYFQTLNNLPLLKELLNPSLTIETSRGCWWGEKKPCKFCGENGVRKNYRKKPVKEILEELNNLSSIYKTNSFFATDNIMDMEFFEHFLPELIKLKKNYEFYYSVKSNLNPHHIELLSKAGVIWLQPGIESLDSRVLSLMNKGVKSWQNINLLKWSLYYGINAMWSYLYGIPGEKDVWYEEMAELIPLLTHLQPPKISVPLHFCRNSIYYNNKAEYDLYLKPSEVYSYTMPLPEDILESLAFYFEETGQNEKETDPLKDLIYPGLALTNKEILKWRKLFWSDRRPELKLKEEKEYLEIKDTRPCALQSFFLLTDIDRDIYLTCEEVPKKALLTERLIKKGFKKCEINKSLKNLIDLKLIINRDERFLSLAVKGPVSSIPHDEKNPLLGLKRKF